MAGREIGEDEDPCEECFAGPGELCTCAGEERCHQDDSDGEWESSSSSNEEEESDSDVSLVSEGDLSSDEEVEEPDDEDVIFVDQPEELSEEQKTYTVGMQRRSAFLRYLKKTDIQACPTIMCKAASSAPNNFTEGVLKTHIVDTDSLGALQLLGKLCNGNIQVPSSVVKKIIMYAFPKATCERLFSKCFFREANFYITNAKRDGLFCNVRNGIVAYAIKIRAAPIYGGSDDQKFFVAENVDEKLVKEYNLIKDTGSDAAMDSEDDDDDDDDDDDEGDDEVAVARHQIPLDHMFAKLNIFDEFARTDLHMVASIHAKLQTPEWMKAGERYATLRSLAKDASTPFWHGVDFFSRISQVFEDNGWNCQGSSTSSERVGNDYFFGVSQRASSDQKNVRLIVTQPEYYVVGMNFPISIFQRQDHAPDFLLRFVLTNMFRTMEKYGLPMPSDRIRFDEEGTIILSEEWGVDKRDRIGGTLFSQSPRTVWGSTTVLTFTNTVKVNVRVVMDKKFFRTIDTLVPLQQDVGSIRYRQHTLRDIFLHWHPEGSERHDEIEAILSRRPVNMPVGIRRIVDLSGFIPPVTFSSGLTVVDDADLENARLRVVEKIVKERLRAHGCTIVKNERTGQITLKLSAEGGGNIQAIKGLAGSLSMIIAKKKGEESNARAKMDHWWDGNFACGGTSAFCAATQYQRHFQEGQFAYTVDEDSTNELSNELWSTILPVSERLCVAEALQPWRSNWHAGSFLRSMFRCQNRWYSRRLPLPYVVLKASTTDEVRRIRSAIRRYKAAQKRYTVGAGDPRASSTTVIIKYPLPSIRDLLSINEEGGPPFLNWSPDERRRIRMGNKNLTISKMVSIMLDLNIRTVTGVQKFVTDYDTLIEEHGARSLEVYCSMLKAHGDDESVDPLRFMERWKEERKKSGVSLTNFIEMETYYGKGFINGYRALRAQGIDNVELPEKIFSSSAMIIVICKIEGRRCFNYMRASPDTLTNFFDVTSTPWKWKKGEEDYAQPHIGESMAAKSMKKAALALCRRTYPAKRFQSSETLAQLERKINDEVLAAGDHGLEYDDGFDRLSNLCEAERKSGVLMETRNVRVVHGFARRAFRYTYTLPDEVRGWKNYPQGQVSFSKHIMEKALTEMAEKASVQGIEHRVAQCAVQGTGRHAYVLQWMTAVPDDDDDFEIVVDQEVSLDSILENRMKKRGFFDLTDDSAVFVEGTEAPEAGSSSSSSSQSMGFQYTGHIAKKVKRE